MAYSGDMKTALPFLALAVAVSACGSPTPAAKAPAVQAEADPVAATRSLFGTDDWTLIGGKCVAVLELPANAGQAENDAAHARWKTWLEKSVPSELSSQMVTLNKQTYAASPDAVMTDAATYCRGKLEEVAPQTAPSATPAA